MKSIEDLLKLPKDCRICSHNNTTWCSCYDTEEFVKDLCEGFELSKFHLSEVLDIMIKAINILR